jgi:hypothetical protein
LIGEKEREREKERKQERERERERESMACTYIPFLFFLSFLPSFLLPNPTSHFECNKLSSFPFNESTMKKKERKRGKPMLHDFFPHPSIGFDFKDGSNKGRLLPHKNEEIGAEWSGEEREKERERDMGKKKRRKKGRKGHRPFLVDAICWSDLFNALGKLLLLLL